LSEAWNDEFRLAIRSKTDHPDSSNTSMQPPPPAAAVDGRSSEPEPSPWSYADQRDRQSPRTAGQCARYHTPGFRRISHSRQIDGFLLNDCFVAASTPGFDSSSCWL
jgi:hypothetical protein